MKQEEHSSFGTFSTFTSALCRIRRRAPPRSAFRAPPSSASARRTAREQIPSRASSVPASQESSESPATHTDACFTAEQPEELLRVLGACTCTVYFPVFPSFEGKLKTGREPPQSSMMATSSFSRVECVGTVSDSFYFEALGTTTTDVYMDSYNINTRCCHAHWVQSKDNKFLLIDREQQFTVKNLTKQQMCQPECKFKIQVYTDFKDVDGEKKTAAMLYVTNDSKNMVACCRQRTEVYEVYAEQMEALPSRIEDTSHKALFFMTALSASHTYEFESSEYPTRFLGFQRDGENPSLNKLVLCSRDEDELDDSCHVILL